MSGERKNSKQLLSSTLNQVLKEESALKKLDVIMEHLGITSRTEGIRHCITLACRQYGLQLEVKTDGKVQHTV